LLINLARAGRVEHSNNCEPTIAETFGTAVFVTFSGKKGKLLIAENNVKVRDGWSVGLV